MRPTPSDFRVRADHIRNLNVAIPVGGAGGYGPDGEVIYLRQPAASPAVLIDTRENVKATFAANGSVGFVVTRPEGMEIPVLSSSFDGFEKRETGTLSGNVWLDLTQSGGGQKAIRRIASLLNPAIEVNLPAQSQKIVKVERPMREIFYCTEFDADGGRVPNPDGSGLGAPIAFASVLRMSLVVTHAGPAILRQLYLRNTGTKALRGKLWSFFNLHGTQKRVYDKEIWYDIGLPLSEKETVTSCTVPYSDIVQLKRISSSVTPGIEPAAATCSYLSFVGDSGQFALLPEAVKRGELLDAAKFGRLNRFTTPTIAANQFKLNVPAGGSACLHQSLLYVSNEEIAQQFRLDSSSDQPGYLAAQKHFAQAAKRLAQRTPDVRAVMAIKPPANDEGIGRFFQLDLPAQKGLAEFLNSVWAGVPDLYGRNYGGRIADGVELPFRDRCQDMRPFMTIDPGRARADLVHTFGFMYQTTDKPIPRKKRLTLLDKLHGSYPRQYPSLWLDRRHAIKNDNRPFSDSAVWLVETVIRYMHETGDASILLEQAETVEFDNPLDPVAIRGGKKRQSIAQAILEIFARYQRLCDDSPYGMVQIMYGDWCDPVDLFGTDRIGDASRRGWGRGVSVRLSAQVVLAAIDTIDVLQAPAVSKMLRGKIPLDKAINNLKAFADRLRQSIMKFAWEEGRGKVRAGFIDSIHELKKDGRLPRTDKGEIGYTLGSMHPDREFDGQPRRVLTTMGYGLKMLLAERDYLSAVPDREAKIRSLLATVDELAYEKGIGLKLYTTPLANSTTTLRYVGRMGLLPSGCGENGEYHHAQAFMHCFRVAVPGQADIAWSQFREILSVTRDEKLLGPFDSLANSYASDRNDPYYGAGMIFGFSGTADLVIETVEKVVGIDLDLLDDRRPDLRINLRLPSELDKSLSFRRIIHEYAGHGRYRQIPFQLVVRKAQRGEAAAIWINGQPATKPEVEDVSGLKKIEMEIHLA